MKKSSPGFTLVELIIAIASAAIVLAAALSFMLLGTRMENRSFGTAEHQQTARIVLTMTEKMAISGEIDKIDRIGESWVLYSRENKPLLQYLSADGSLRMGNSVFMRNLENAKVTFAENNKLFTLTLITEYDTYSTTVYCRTGEIDQMHIEHGALLNKTEESLGNTNARTAFLNVLCNQYGSTGQIIGSADDAPKYFSEWYIKQQDHNYVFGSENGWGKDTPWCACFISWAAAQNEALDHAELTQSEHYFANVDSGMAVFKDSSKPGTWLSNSATPTPGDIAFFSWDGDDNPEHVGAVLHIDDSNIYTIEGNSGGKVTVNRYALDSEDIIGYGVLEWKT